MFSLSLKIMIRPYFECSRGLAGYGLPEDWGGNDSVNYILQQLGRQQFRCSM
jgi:hypothetical protein